MGLNRSQGDREKLHQLVYILIEVGCLMQELIQLACMVFTILLDAVGSSPKIIEFKPICRER